MKKIVFIFICLFGWIMAQNGVSSRPALDLNRANLEQIKQLPVPEDIAVRIYERVLYKGPFESVYELMGIKGFTPELLAKVKPLVIINPFEKKSDWQQRLENLMYQMQRWEGSEGVNQVLVDYWYEQAMNPLDVNDVSYAQLANLQAVSPVDAAAILKYRSMVGKISSSRDLRSASNLSYFGFRNARNFLAFEQPAMTREVHGHWRMRMDDSPLLADEADADQQIPQTFAIGNNYPAMYSSFSGTYGKNIRFGFSQYHAYREPYSYEDVGVLQLPKPKFYVGLENINLGNLKVDKLYAGYYSLSFGKGVVMRNTDYFTPRNSGFGFRKSFIGLSGDNSINRQYALRGLAAEFSYRKMNAWLFGSYMPRDAILNVQPEIVNGKPQQTVNQFIVLDQRYRFAPADFTRQENNLSWLDAVHEMTYGGRLQYNFLPGTWVGAIVYESLYDKLLRPNYKEIVHPDNYGQITGPDAEMFATYGGPDTDGESPLWGNAKSFRRVYGFDFQYVVENVALQGEYAELDKNHNFSLLGDNPSALVLSSYVQFNSLNFLALYRNYDLEFDNPYQRSFSNYRRFKKTIYEDYYYLQDPLYGQLYSNNPQPQAEKGFYLNTRYQINRYLVPRIEYDNWKRKSDDASYYRLSMSVDVRPIFPLRLNLRQKYQGREVNNEKTLQYYETNEFRGRLRMLLSDYNELGLIFATSSTKFTPRPRLVFPAETGADGAHVLRSGTAEAPGNALGGFFRYRVGDWIKLSGSLLYYKGFFWNFEDTQFQVMDSKNGAFRTWMAMYTRLSPRFSIHAKLTWDKQREVTDIASRNSSNEPLPDANSGTGKYYQSRLSLEDQFFYLFELNYHF